MKHIVTTFLLVFVILAAIAATKAEAQFIKDPEIISEYLDTLILTPEERRHLQQMYEMVGLRVGKIVGGEDADIADYPWTVALVTAGGSQYCGGTVIDEEWILTAAHCIGSSAFIRAGVTNKNDTSGQDRQAVQIINHPEYVSVTQGRDISLLRLGEPLDLSDPNVAIAPISTEMHNLLGFEDEGVPSIITGWGRLFSGGPAPDILQWAEVPIVSNEQAQVGYPNVVITDDMIAAGLWGEGGVDACQGDSGGPLVVPDDSSPVGYVVAGITSWGTGCAGPTHMGMYARVSYFEDWIFENSGLSFPGPGEDDGIPPATITDLSVTGLPTENSITLSWTAPGGSGDEGRAGSYDLRVSDAPIDETNFDDATPVEGVGRPLQAGTAEVFTVEALEPLTEYYFALKASDFFGNESGLSNVVNTATDGSPRIEFSATSFDLTLSAGSTAERTLTLTNTGEGLLTYALPSFMNEERFTAANIRSLNTTAFPAGTAENRAADNLRQRFHLWESGARGPLSTYDQQLLDDRIEAAHQGIILTDEPSVTIPFENLTATGGEFFDVTGDGFTNELTAVRADFVINQAGGQTWASDLALLITNGDEISPSTVVLQVGGFSDFGPSGTRIPWGTGNTGAPNTPVQTTIAIPTPLLVDDLTVWIGHGWGNGSSSTWSGEIEMIGISEAAAFISSISPASGSLAVGESVDLTITFDTADLEEGEYEATTQLRSNDLTNPVTMLSFTLLVGPEDGLIVSPRSLDFGEAEQGQSVELPATVINSAEEAIEITGFSLDSDAFAADVPLLTLAPGETADFTVSFNPVEIGDYSATLSIESTAENSPALISLSGVGLEADGPFSMVTFRLDMSVMKAEGTFIPEAGDEVFVRGNFGAWGLNPDFMLQQNGDTIYEAELFLDGEPGRVFEYKYFIQAGDGRSIPNGGWELNTVGEDGNINRVVTLSSPFIMLPIVYYNNQVTVDTETDFEMPAQFTLSQNYPNPFNPTTTIRWEMPEAAEVSLEVFNLQGQRVAQLAGGMHTAGTHTVSFDASRLASGMYVYRLRAGDFVQTRSMMLLK
ncbi:Por secretion system C-terminal sorting domain-containing protein [Cyclonatronum proteinivorum]|uniref:Por secretion system C-terminal sorting domain-containing protein n=1 Tax=Cyclonatronum proteinivorum TaxID=1457365 RepID=A0A345UP33_9BACT|nr:trypsin-like serine protease [Cyclonatronum proteinivorum]AXJ02235.1 Por secretion system C-terminal sorting domain-containing protein [Cyclonatronum proteinivorum]